MTDSSYDGNQECGVLKTDVLGRVKTGARQREALLDEFERSGLSGTKFAAVAGVNYQIPQSGTSWVQKRRKATGAYRPAAKRSNQGKSARQAATTLPALGWVEAVVETAKHEASAGGPEALRLELPCGASLQITNEAQAVLAACLLRALHHPMPTTSC